VPWRFSDAGKQRAQLKRRDAASEKPAQSQTLAQLAPTIQSGSLQTFGSRRADPLRPADLALAWNLF